MVTSDIESQYLNMSIYPLNERYVRKVTLLGPDELLLY